MAEPRSSLKRSRPAKAALQLRIEPLTPHLWPALEDLFGERGACNGCWCMYWRIGGAYSQRPREKNKAAFKAIVKKGPPPGLLAFEGDNAVGWAQLTPRAALPRLDRGRFTQKVDDVPVWSLSCFFIRMNSSAWIMISVAVPSMPARGWWIMIRPCGREFRFPLAPAARSSEPMLAHWPMQ